MPDFRVESAAVLQSDSSLLMKNELTSLHNICGNVIRMALAKRNLGSKEEPL
jgi:hypothetical protein